MLRKGEREQRMDGVTASMDMNAKEPDNANCQALWRKLARKPDYSMPVKVHRLSGGKSAMKVLPRVNWSSLP